MTIIDTIQRYRDQLDALLTGQLERTDHPRPLADRPLADQLALFEEIAQGKHDRAQTDPAFVAEVEEAVKHLLVLFCVPPDKEKRIIEVIPRDVWTRSHLGILLAEVAWWVYQDDLITLSEAAQRLYGGTAMMDLHGVRTHINKGQLTPYIDPHESNPRYAGRVRRSEVQELKERSEQVPSEQEHEPQAEESAPDIIAMHDNEGLTFAEIGRRLGKHRQQIHTMYHRLKQQQSNS